MVVANILAGPLVELAPRLAGYAAPGATLILSGVLAGHQASMAHGTARLWLQARSKSRRSAGWNPSVDTLQLFWPSQRPHLISRPTGA